MSGFFSIKSNRKLLAFFTILGMVWVVFSLSCIFSGISEKYRTEYNTTTDLTNAWTYEDGTYADLSKIRGSKTFIYKFDGDTLRSRYLCFKSKNINFTISVNDIEIYEFKPTVPKLFGRSYGIKMHTVFLGECSGETTLKIDCDSIYDDTTAYFNNICLDYSEDFISNSYKKNMISFLICIIIFLLGLLMTISSILTWSSERRLEILSIGIFGMTTACWSVTETMILQMLTDNSAAVHYMNYVTQMLMPISCMIFLPSIAGFSKNILANLTGVLALLNAVTMTILTLLGIMDYHDTLIVNHVIFGSMIIVCAYFIITTIHNRNISTQNYLSIISAFGIVVVGGSLDLVKWYFFKKTNDSSSFLRISMLIFMVIMVFYEVFELIRSRRYAREASLMRKLAYTDSLTSLRNRMAYNKDLEEISQQDEGKCAIIQFDTNNLKVINDNYGHSEGDKYLCGAANIIQENFSEYGTAYRTGGDEFIVLIIGNDCLENYKLGIEKMLKAIDEYNAKENPPVKLSIAYGYSIYDYSTHDPEKAGREADENMYQTKRQMKKQASQ